MLENSLNLLDMKSSTPRTPSEASHPQSTPFPNPSPLALQNQLKTSSQRYLASWHRTSPAQILPPQRPNLPRHR